MARRTLTKAPATQSVAPGASAVLQSASAIEIGDADVYLLSIGTAIDPISNANFVTMFLRVNGIPFYPFDNLGSQIGTPTLFQQLSEPVLLGHGCAVDVFGAMGSGATGNTKMVAGFILALTKAGERP